MSCVLSLMFLLKMVSQLCCCVAPRSTVGRTGRELAVPLSMFGPRGHPLACHRDASLLAARLSEFAHICVGLHGILLQQQYHTFHNVSA